MEQQTEKKLVFNCNGQAANILGERDENLSLLEENLLAKIVVRGNELVLSGSKTDVDKARMVFEHLFTLAEAGILITKASINYSLSLLGNNKEIAAYLAETVYVTPRGKQVKAKTLGQWQYLEAIRNHDITFSIGPAGTGKTYLAVVMAVAALKAKEVNKIVLARPAVEAGEKLGFLPGDLQDKVNPYLRPVYDALDDILGQEIALKYMERGTVEVVPLAYMRGRTLDDAFIILDEAQNTTSLQMKMFLTRMGMGSKVVITGDITQIDLPDGQRSGLVEAERRLKDISGLAFCHLTILDTVRHPLVQKIIDAYDKKWI